MAKWINDPQGREEVEQITEELKLPLYKPSAKGKFRPWLKEVWNKIEDYSIFLKNETIKLKASDEDIKDNRWRLYAKMIGNTSTNTDLNDIKEVGWYYSASSSNKFTNMPAGASMAFVLYIESISPEVPEKYLVQEYRSFINNEIYRRVRLEFKWLDWQKVADDLSRYEGTISKKSGFNLDKSDVPVNDTNKLFTAMGALALDNKKMNVYQESNIKNYDDLLTDGFYILGGQADPNVKNAPYNDKALVHVWRFASYVYQHAVSYYDATYHFTRCFQVEKKNVKWERILNTSNLHMVCPYRIGEFYITSHNANPAVLWTGTTWEKVEGRFIRGTTSGQSAGIKGSSDTRTLTEANLAPHAHAANSGSAGEHTHTQPAHIHTQPAHTHSTSPNLYTNKYNISSSGTEAVSHYDVKHDGDHYREIRIVTNSAGGENTGSAAPAIHNSGSHVHPIIVSSTGSGEPFNILPSYITAYIWIRLT